MEDFKQIEDFIFEVLTPKYKEEAMQVLADCFADEPVLSFNLPDRLKETLGSIYILPIYLIVSVSCACSLSHTNTLTHSLPTLFLSPLSLFHTES